MEVSHVERAHDSVLNGIAHIELVRADRIAFETHAEHLAFDGILHVRALHGEDLVQRILQQRAVQVAVDGQVLRSVVNPQVVAGLVAELLTHLVGDLAAADRMLDPEVADALVAVRQRLVAALRVRETSAVEVELHVVGLGPVDPALEVLRLDLVAVDLLAAEVAVDGVDVQTMVTGEQRLDLFDVLADLLDVAGLARIVARSLNTSGELAVGILETGHVVGLPAVQRQRYLGNLFEHGVGIHADFGIALLGGLVGFLNLCVFHWSLGFKLKRLISMKERDRPPRDGRPSGFI